MPFSIVSSRPGAFSVMLEGELDTATLGILRFELATVLSTRPREVELRVPRATSVGGAGWGLLQAFFDVFWSRGGRLVVARAEEPAVAVGDLTHLRRVLAAPGPAGPVMAPPAVTGSSPRYRS
jgi:hypothetical protein